MLKPLTRRIQIIHRDGEMPKALWFAIATMVFEILILFRAAIPREFENPLKGLRVDIVVRPGYVAEEIEVETRGRRFGSPEQRHAQRVLIELQ